MSADHRQFAQEWIAAWNSHDLDAIMSHYSSDVVLRSPTVTQLLGDASGQVHGRDALRAYFAEGLRIFPNLHFELIGAYAGIGSVVLIFRNQRGGQTAEYMERDALGRVTLVSANYSTWSAEQLAE